MKIEIALYNPVECFYKEFEYKRYNREIKREANLLIVDFFY